MNFITPLHIQGAAMTGTYVLLRREEPEMDIRKMPYQNLRYMTKEMYTKNREKDNMPCQFKPLK